MTPLFHIPIKRTRDGGKTHYINKYWAFPISKELRIHNATFKPSNLTLGFNLYYKGEEVFYVWPWKRQPFFNEVNNRIVSSKWISVCSEGYFSSLKEVDQFWVDFYMALSKKTI